MENGKESGKIWPRLGRDTLNRNASGRGRPSFLTRAATDDAAQLLRRTSLPRLFLAEGSSGSANDQPPTSVSQNDGSAEVTERSQLVRDDGEISRRRVNYGTSTAYQPLSESVHLEPPIPEPESHTTPQSPPMLEQKEQKKPSIPKVGSFPRPVGGTEKLNTFSGVFVPTSLNVLSILMFIRFGFILGQTGALGMLAMLAVAYLINVVTTMSLSAVASNGTVRGGGAYYLIARSLGPEFGGSIGIVSYLGFVFNTGMNAVGLIDCLNYNFGTDSGNWYNFLPEGPWWQYLWSTLVVLVCVGICLAGSAIFARASNGLLFILLVATLSIPLSSAILKPFGTAKQFTEFTGLSATTLRRNLLPHFTKGAAGSQLETRENYQDLFGILFPATGGILAGASMSGDLKNPSRSIPRGTLAGLALTFISYALVILAMAASITRQSFYRNVNIVQDTNVSGILILAGEISTTFFSVLMGIIGPAKQLQAIARDQIVPGLTIFGQGSKETDEPLLAILFTFAVAQLTLLLDINRIASLITMTYLMTFFALNLATFLLKIGSAPNFRPSFQYFSVYTAALGALLSVASMFFVDGLSAFGSICILLLLVTGIHYTTPPKPWGSISEVLIYHQVRKYLLRLRNEHVKFWRPQILLFVNDPRRGYKLIQFCNSLKKGGLFILGHVLVTQNFGASVPEARRQQAAWTKYIDFSKIKAFVNVAISPSIEWGSRNIVLSAGLGSMRPNIIVFGVYNLQQFRSEQPLVDVPSPPPERKQDSATRRRRQSRGQVKGALPTDICYVEKRTDVQSYVMVLEDMILKLKTNVMIAANFSDLELPNAKEGNTKQFIDLWPIQMSAEVAAEDKTGSQNVLTTNFDTYTLILQLGCILHTVRSWKRSYKLRVAVFVEYESDVEEERARVTSLLENLRIEATVLVFWLACGEVKSYEYIVNGKEVDVEASTLVDKTLEDEEWWQELEKLRGKVRTGDFSVDEVLSLADDIQWPSSSFSNRRETSTIRFEGLKKLISNTNRRHSVGDLSNLGVNLSMRTSRLDDDMLSRHASHPSDSEYTDSAVETDGDFTDDEDETEDETESTQEVFDDDEENGNANNTSQEATGLREPLAGRASRATSSKKSSLASSKISRGSKKHKRQRPALIAPTDSDTVAANASDEGIHFVENVFEATPNDGRGRTTDSKPAVSSGLEVGDDYFQKLHVDKQPRSRRQSPNFTSTPLPVTKVASEEGVGPSIMFADQDHPRRRAVDDKDGIDADDSRPNPSRSIYTRNTEVDSPSRTFTAGGTASTPASGYPSAASVPISFNDLPCRAQHLILNDLISQNSEDTAVIFTTLPAPVEGTFKSENDALVYVSDLEVLYGGLPPVLLVHSNSMTVTTNL